jgi:hypothetical protein
MKALPAELAHEMAAACRAAHSKRRRVLAKLEAKNPADEHLPSMRRRLARLEAAIEWIGSPE